MKILEHGRYYIENRITNCMCGCKFEYEIEDIFIDKTLTYTSNPPQNEEYVLCPECNARINLGKRYAYNIGDFK